MLARFLVQNSTPGCHPERSEAILSAPSCVTLSAPSYVTLSEAKGLARWVHQLLLPFESLHCYQ